MDTWSVNICHFRAHDFSAHHSTRKHARCSWKSWNCIAKKEEYFEEMWKCQVNHMVNSAFMFSSSTVIRNGALLVIDCSGCLHYGTEMHVKGFDRSLFRADIAQSPLVIGSPDGVYDLLDLYNTTILGLLNKHAPEKEKVVPDRPSSPWINEAVIKAKQARRRAERKKRKTGLVVLIEIYKQARNNVTKLIKQAKASHFHAKSENAATDSKKMFSQHTAKQREPVRFSARHDTPRSC